MTDTIEILDFDAAKVELVGSNLIEASAGTGKTYSIAVLALRLILEKDITINKILMVTFTKAAVAELEERVRLFVRKAYKCSMGDATDDNTISLLVQRSMDAAGGDADVVRKKLKNSLLLLDETGILTIHSFCGQTLHEFAFETNQIFGSEILQDTRRLLAEEVNRFWRNYITLIETPILEILLADKFTRKTLNEVVQNHMSGKRYFMFDPNTDYHKAYDAFVMPTEDLLEAVTRRDGSRRELEVYVQGNWDDIVARCGKGHPKNFIEKYNSPEEFIAAVADKPDTGYIVKLFREVVEGVQLTESCEAEVKAIIQTVKDLLICLAIEEVARNFEMFKKNSAILTFDDMIGKLHATVYGASGDRLIPMLNQKYGAVFIDEFQDTDKMQFEVFDRLFNGRSILFYIGDPKQSIYAWRKADIYTYFRAKQSSRVYSMNCNYRSNEGYIAALNTFFAVDDPFFFDGVPGYEQAITYVPVQSPANNAKGVLIRGDGPDAPFTIVECANKETIIQSVATHVAELLFTKVYSVVKNGAPRLVRPSDIGILVRTKKEAAAIKVGLAKQGIAAVSIGDERILESHEAVDLLYLLLAIEEPSKSNINRALYTPFTGLTKAQVLQLDDEKVLERFKKWKTTADERGIYTALMEFVSDFDVRNVLLNDDSGMAERSITNLFHLMEVLHKMQRSRKFSILELCTWLKKGIDGMQVEGDEFEQRMESDRETVKIVTIHKSKGLEYGIVFAPHLDMKPEPHRDSFAGYRDPATGDYMTCETARLDADQKALVLQQNEQENRRLVYVAVTRAVHKIYLYTSGASRFKDSSLKVFIAGLTTAPPIGFEVLQGADYIAVAPAGGTAAATRQAPHVRTCAHFALMHANWQKSSYSGLAAKLEAPALPMAGEPERAYDRFVFGEMGRGRQVGNMLHFVLENIHFRDDRRWAAVITEAVDRFGLHFKNDRQQLVAQMLQEVLNAEIVCDGATFHLSDIDHRRRLHELEFDFQVPLFNPTALNGLSDDQIMVRAKPYGEMEGLINGKIDLFFEHGGKYYILDWKSNFLGSHIDDYRPDPLLAAMNDHNYHLQYLIYSLAVDKYLASRLRDDYNYDTHFGGVVYCFLRGMRRGAGTGVYACKPTQAQLGKLRGILGVE